MYEGGGGGSEYYETRKEDGLLTAASPSEEVKAEVEGGQHSLCVDNSSTVLNKIANLYAERLMSDVCLVVENVEYPSHRLILCASSDVFQVMLMNPNWTESQESRIILRESPACASVFENFLKYFYTGRIRLDYATVIPLVSLADKYDVKDLLRLGLDYMGRNISTAAKKNQLVAWYQFAAGAGHSKLATLAENFMRWNFETVSQTLDFVTLEAEQLLCLIQSNDLVVEDETVVFTVVQRWLEAKKKIMEGSGEENVDLHMDRYVQLLLPHVRFPMMTRTQLAELLLMPLSETHTDLIVEKIRLAMCYHTNKLEPYWLRDRKDERVRKADEDRRIYTPRLYKTERFCASLSIDYFRNLRSYHCRSLLFSSQKHTAEYMGDEQSEWIVDVYPKGVWFQKCITVYLPPGLEVPEKILKIVRVSVSSTQCYTTSTIQRVRIGLLILGNQDNFEHVRTVVSRNYFFSENDMIVNFDDIVDFEELNHHKHTSHFLTGPRRDSFKILVVIVPLSDLSSLT